MNLVLLLIVEVFYSITFSSMKGIHYIKLNLKKTFMGLLFKNCRRYL